MVKVCSSISRDKKGGLVNATSFFQKAENFGNTEHEPPSASSISFDKKCEHRPQTIDPANHILEKKIWLKKSEGG